MARPLRIAIMGGWYHITMRGQRREQIYYDHRDRKEFLERLEEMSHRYGVEVHAYVLMSNHYHLLIRTPRGNASEAMQWLNNGYGMWWNRRHNQVGHVFQGRFKSVVVEGGGWLLELSLYLHYNPVAIKSLGWGKAEKRAEGQGLKRPRSEVIMARLETLRGHRWSSYRGYAGYEPTAKWLSTGEILGRVKGGREGYRQKAEERLAQGQSENIWSKLKWGVVLGSDRFSERIRIRAKVVRETQGRGTLLRKRLEWAEIVQAVAQVKGEAWSLFVNRHGDWGRDLAFWLGRRHAGMSLKELGREAGGMDYSAVSEAIRRFEKKRCAQPSVCSAYKRVCQKLKMET